MGMRTTTFTRRRAFLALVIGLVAVATSAQAQTSSSSSSSSSTTTSTTTTTPTTTAPVVLPCPASGCTELPPPAFLRSAAGEVAGTAGSHCWQVSNRAVCRDAILVDPAEALTVRPDELLVLRFGTAEQPAEIAVHTHDRVDAPLLGGDPQVIVPGNPVTFRVGSDEGTRWLVVSTKWLQGSSLTHFEVRVVRHVATATPARVGVTG